MDLAQDLKNQMAQKEFMKANEKFQDWVADMNHLDTIEFASPYGK